MENEGRFVKSTIDDWLSSQSSRSTLLQQAGAFADDDSLYELRESIYRDRGRSEVEESPDGA